MRRFRPIMRTAAGAILVLIPLARSILWVPLAFAMFGGILVATVLTILVLPAAYALFVRLAREKDATNAAAEGFAASPVAAE